jgi:hypothetical protein
VFGGPIRTGSSLSAVCAGRARRLCHRPQWHTGGIADQLSMADNRSTGHLWSLPWLGRVTKQRSSPVMKQNRSTRVACRQHAGFIRLDNSAAGQASADLAGTPTRRAVSPVYSADIIDSKGPQGGAERRVEFQPGRLSHQPLGTAPADAGMQPHLGDIGLICGISMRS